ncbi:MAG: tRNA 2-thiouridine(34) synthase MnmA [Lachnospiraceae bacterium]|nr:tRNA 2-thiouridine(34) synthase MnmA [Lachnospiraceae bacterium]
MSKVLVAMSGGVDSSVAAKLLVDAGYECVGCTMKLFDQDEDRSKTCCSTDDTEDARSVAYRLGMQFYTFNFKDEFRKRVIDDFVDNYLTGRTPNPCIECNRFLKFGKLFDRADELGCEYVATGHYARIVEQNGEKGLLKAVDEKKDQSYVLYMLGQKELNRLMLPLGELTKPEVRRVAEENGFVNAHKAESQDICFVPDGDYATAVERFCGSCGCNGKGRRQGPGNFVDTYGNVLGKHKGIIHYTVGQRRGLGISGPEPYYVLKIDTERNEVVLGAGRELFSREVFLKELFHVQKEALSDGLRCSAKIRYHHVEQPGILKKDVEGYRFIFDEPQRAVTPGQSLVLYEGSSVLGGGKII